MKRKKYAQELGIRAKVVEYRDSGPSASRKRFLAVSKRGIQSSQRWELADMRGESSSFLGRVSLPKAKFCSVNEVNFAEWMPI